MKLTIVGGGGFRVPLVYGALLRGQRAPGPGRARPARRRRRRASPESRTCSGDSPAEHGGELPFRTHHRPRGRRSTARTSCFCAIRVGLLEGRVVDESVPLGHGVLGQETTGPGGICFALRTIPAMIEIAEVVAERAPGAWLINFTNPAGHGHRGGPAGARRSRGRHLRLAVRTVPARRRGARPRSRASSGSTTSASTTSAGSSGVRDGERRPPARSAGRRRAAGGFEEGRLFGGEWLRSLGMVPNEYLYYFYYAADTVDAIRDSAELARRVPARAAARVLRPRRPASSRGAGRLARDAP